MATPRVLVVDDMPSIHVDYDRILNEPSPSEAVSDIEAELFGADEPTTQVATPHYAVDHAYSGEQAIALVRDACANHAPYSVAFMDVRMPPGIDGIQTARKIWEIDPRLQIVICSAYSDYTWQEVLDVLGITDNLLVLGKPFDVMEVQQLSMALVQKRLLAATLEASMQDLERMLAHPGHGDASEVLERMRMALGGESSQVGAL